MKNKKPKAFGCYLDNYTILEHLSDSQAGQLWKMLFRLALNSERENCDDPMVDMAYALMAQKQGKKQKQISPKVSKRKQLPRTKSKRKQKPAIARNIKMNIKMNMKIKMKIKMKMNMKMKMKMKMNMKRKRR